MQSTEVKRARAGASSGKLRKRVEQAQQWLRHGRPEEARRRLTELAERHPDAPEPMFALAMLAVRRGAAAEAEQWLRRCTQVAPGHAGAQVNLGNLLFARGEVTAAEEQYRIAARQDPRDAVAHYNLGRCQSAAGRPGDAAASYRRALELDPRFDEAALNLAAVLVRCERYAEAEALYHELLQRRPDRTAVRLDLAALYRAWGRADAARREYQAALEAAPGDAKAALGLASALISEGQLEEAEQRIEAVEAGAGAPRAELLRVRASLQAARGELRAAVEAMAEVIRTAGTPVDHQRAAAWCVDLRERQRAVEILAAGVERFGESDPSLLISLVLAQRHLCDWQGSEARLERALAALRAGEPQTAHSPFALMSLPGLTAADLQRLTRAYARRFAGAAALACAHPGDAAGRRLRIGYLSADLHEHATAYLAAGVFERHDRDRFEVFAYSYGPDDGSRMRARLRGAFEHFVDLADASDAEAAERICRDGIDLLIDLKGYTRGARPGVLARRPAPVQVGWLGYPGTLGADFLDYLIADAVVVPPAGAVFYDEALAYLPHTYAPVDPLAAPPLPAGGAPARTGLGLPERGFVFCCFNNPRKITAQTFERWCRLLEAVPESVLWLFAPEEAVVRNLTAEAGRRGVSAERLVFAGHVPQAEHLARLARADLVLDTLPYNAHTTASDALKMGVPVLTCPGETFPSRVAASLLQAAGLPELIAADPEDYERTALRLASAPERLRALRQRLAAAWHSAPYFDTAAFTRDLEALYRRMWQRHREGQPPAMLSTKPDAG